MKEIKITDIDGIKIGNKENHEGGTGCTVIICEEGGVAGVDVRGGGPASHETELLNPINTVDKIHGLTLSGGSAFGLEASSGVMEYLEEKGIGFQVEDIIVPIVCGASLFDLMVASHKIRPDKAMGYEACIEAEKNSIKNGNFGAGLGCSVGKIKGMDRAMKGGLGGYAVKVGDLEIGAIVAVNAVGDVYDIETNKIIAGVLSEDKSEISSTVKILVEDYKNLNLSSNTNTTIGCIITNGKLTKAQATKISSIAHNGYARAISPVHTSLDGDTIFTLATSKVDVPLDTIGVLATHVMEKAIITAIKSSESIYGLKAFKDFN